MELTPNPTVTYKHSVVGPLDYRPYKPRNFRAYVVRIAICARALNVISRRGGSTQLEQNLYRICYRCENEMLWYVPLSY
jgi:hypothetical protein